MCIDELYRCIGQTVTIFTASGGASGCGFTGVLTYVSPQFVTLVNQFGAPPSNPLSEAVCCRGNSGCAEDSGRRSGSACDIPTNMIAGFCHSAF
ncbi:hypothetical protein HNQ56_001325 [Anaerotaenia torta]|uniref:hypothetical protein n=1 Tax=Anaerotaenia torta TaxID=433293 RepID=UPI003D219F71